MNIVPLTDSAYPENTVRVILVKDDARILTTHTDGVINELRFGIGKGPWDAEMLVRQVVRHALTLDIKALAFDFPALEELSGGGFAESGKRFALASARAAMMAGYTFDIYKKEKTPAPAIYLGSMPEDYHASAEIGSIIGDHVNRARKLANMGASDVTPEYLEDYAVWVHGRHPNTVQTNVFDAGQLAQLELNLILAVGKGSQINPPRMVTLAYTGNPESERVTVICGKGVCYDTGGLSMKSSDAMLLMHHDMAGAGTTIEIIDAIATLGIRKNVTAYIPLVENSVSDRSYRPGDVIKSSAGISVEVTNTDAEGRLVLADALWYAHRNQNDVDAIFTIATLTGAAMIALGDAYSGVFSMNDRLVDDMVRSGELAFDPVWRLPLSPAFAHHLKSKRADIMNAHTGSKNGGASSAAWFLQWFADAAGLGDRFAHIDIAPRMVQTSPEDHLAPGSMGAGVSLFVEYFLQKESVYD